MAEAKERTPIEAPVVARFIDWFRETFKINWQTITTRTQLEDIISTKQKRLSEKLKKGRTKELQTQYEELRKVRGLVRKSDLLDQMMKDLDPVKSYKRGDGTTVDSYAKTWNRWERKHEFFVVQRMEMKGKELQNQLNQEFGTAYTYESVIAKRARLKKKLQIFE